MAHICALLIMILGRFSKYLHEIYGASFCTEYAWGPRLQHILRKFTGLKEGVGENIPNTGRVIVSSRQFKWCYFVVRHLI